MEPGGVASELAEGRLVVALSEVAQGGMRARSVPVLRGECTGQHLHLAHVEYDGTGRFLVGESPLEFEDT